MKICESEMSKDMVLAISKKSKKFYIIPRNGSSKEQTSMYGTFIYFLREKGQEGVLNSLLDGRAEEINELMRDAGFKELLNPFDPSSWKLSTLLEDIKSMLDDHSSSISMLFFELLYPWMQWSHTRSLWKICKCSRNSKNHQWNTSVEENTKGLYWHL